MEIGKMYSFLRKLNAYFANHDETISIRNMLSLISLVIVARVIPHPANFTPLIAAVCYLAQIHLPRTRYFYGFVCLLMVSLSDVILGWYFSYPMIGYWSFFTWSALLIIYAGFSSIKHYYLTNTEWPFLIITASFFHWLYTNFGVWLLSQYYPLTLQGLMECYTAALPFLKNQCLGDLCYFALFQAIKLMPKPNILV